MFGCVSEAFDKKYFYYLAKLCFVVWVEARSIYLTSPRLVKSGDIDSLFRPLKSLILFWSVSFSRRNDKLRRDIVWRVRVYLPLWLIWFECVWCWVHTLLGVLFLALCLMTSSENMTFLTTLWPFCALSCVFSSRCMFCLTSSSCFWVENCISLS